MSPNDFGLGLDSSLDDGDLQVSDTTICVAFVACAEYDWSLGVNPSPRGPIVADQLGLLCNTDT